MPMFMLENLRHEARFVLVLSARDWSKRLSIILLMAGVCWFAGARSGVLTVLALHLLAEAAAAVIVRVQPPPEEDLPTWLVACMCVANMSSAVLAVIPAGILMSRPEVPFVMAGFIFLFGIYVHISNKYVALPLYNRLMMAAAVGTGTVCIAWSALAHGGPDAPAPWLLVGALFVVYCANTVQTMEGQKEFRLELAAARAEARSRLRELEHLTRHDPLTDLLNRRAFDEGMGALLADGADRGVAAFLIDLDGFKTINDTHSHAAGDAVLVAVAGRLAALAGPEGLAARLGGDEFALAIPGLASEEAAFGFARRIIREIERPVGFEGKELLVGGSVGVSLGGAAAGGGVGALMAEADRAMYRAKAAARAGRGRHAHVHAPVPTPPRPKPGERPPADASQLQRVGGVRRP
jgi:diguanylate cyclase (GGDEF)-like protein